MPMLFTVFPFKEIEPLKEEMNAETILQRFDDKLPERAGVSESRCIIEADNRERLPLLPCNNPVLVQGEDFFSGSGSLQT